MLWSDPGDDQKYSRGIMALTGGKIPATPKQQQDILEAAAANFETANRKRDNNNQAKTNNLDEKYKSKLHLQHQTSNTSAL
jgi:hypothetical protein